MNNLIGAHLPMRGCGDIADEIGATTIQFFWGSPRTWASPSITDESAAVWREFAEEIPFFIHAPYLVNPASSNQEVRSRSLTALQVQLDGAAKMGASGVIVHAGHAAGETIKDACEHWAETMNAVIPTGVPVLIENTAGGSSAPGRTLEGLALLWKSLSGISGIEYGFCLDTCHAWAGGLDPFRLYEELTPIVGKIDLIHMNGSNDARGSGRDHHANLVTSGIPVEVYSSLLFHCDAPVILEVPGPGENAMADLQLVREIVDRL